MADPTIQTGKKAPEFSLPDQNGDKVKLADLRGQWVVLYFYPKDDTPGCTTEACEFTEGIEAFRLLDATVLGCSPDSPDEHRKFVEKYNLGLILLSDPDKKVMAKYGAFGEKNSYGKIVQGVIRSTVLIDPQGKVACHWPNVKAKGHAEKVRAQLEQLQAG